MKYLDLQQKNRKKAGLEYRANSYLLFWKSQQQKNPKRHSYLLEMKEEIQKYRRYTNGNLKIKRYLKVKLMQNILMARFLQLNVVYNSPFWLYNVLIFFFSLFVANKPKSYFWEFNILKTKYRRIPILHGEQNWMKWLFVVAKKLFSKFTAWHTWDGVFQTFDTLAISKLKADENKNFLEHQFFF